jgi:ribonuclease D
LCRGDSVVIGLDTEWFPDVLPGFRNKTAVLQLAFSQTCFVLSIIHMNCSQLLRNILADPTILKTGQEVLYDAERLEESYGLKVRGLVDLKDIADKNKLGKSSLSDLYQRVTGEELKKVKKVTMSNWEKRPLTPQQISYAALDAIVSRDVFLGLYHLHGEGKNLSQWLEENAFLLDKRREQGDKSFRWATEESTDDGAI